MTITPKAAEEFLVKSHKRTVICPVKINEIARKINLGTFTPYPSIYIDENDVIKDGVSRLQAVIETGKDVRVNVEANISTNNVDFDTGIYRDLSKRLSDINGSNAIYANDYFCNGLSTYFKMRYDKNILNEEAMRFIETNEQYINKAIAICDAFRQYSFIYPITYIAVLIAIMNGVDERICTNFISEICTNNAINTDLDNNVLYNIRNISQLFTTKINIMGHSPRKHNEKKYVLWLILKCLYNCVNDKNDVMAMFNGDTSSMPYSIDIKLLV